MRQQFRSGGFPTVAVCVLFLWYSAGRAQQPTNASERAHRARMLQQIDSLLERKYVLPDRAREYAEAFHEVWRSGGYDSTANPKDFAAKVTADLRAITKDEHILFRLVESSDVGEKAEGALHHPVRYYRLRLKENAGFSRLEWLDGNVGLLELRRFNAISEAKEMMTGAMTFLANANAIIVDIRENGGGSGDYLSSYFLTHPTQLTGSYSREDDFLAEFWTSGDVTLQRLTDVPLYVLTSKRTFSAAESFAYDMKVRKRATLIGEPTRGGAHSVDVFNIGGTFEIYIPTERAVNPVTGGNWESTGVIPDVAVPAAAALDTALVLAREAGKAHAAAKEKDLKPAIREMESQMTNAEHLFRTHQTRAANAALDSLFSTAMKFGLLTEFFVDVLAYNFTSKGDEQILYAILQKNTELFPRSSTACETFAYACFRNGDNQRAIENYRRVLGLDPENRNAKRMIQRLEQK